MLSFDFTAWPPGVALALGTLLVLIIDWVTPLPYAISPGHFFYKLAQGFDRQLSKKASTTHLPLYGALSLVVYFALIGTLLFALLFIAPNDLLTQSALFYLALGYQDVAKAVKQSGQLLEQGQKSAAKSQISTLSQYDVKPLSELGLFKLLNETLVLRFFALWLMPVLLFMLLNGAFALLYRALYEAVRCWSHNIGFSSFARGLNNFIELIPTWLFAPLYSVFKLSQGWLKSYSDHKTGWQKTSLNSNNQLVWLAIAAKGCRCEFAGPVRIGEQKFERPRINKGSPVSFTTTVSLLKWHNRFRLVFMMLITIVGLLFWGLS